MMRAIGTVIDKYLQILSQIYNEGIGFITKQGNYDDSGLSITLH